MRTIARFRAVSHFVAILLMLAFVSTEPVWADITITIQDLGDTLTVDTPLFCFGETCSGPIEGPPGAQVAFTTLPMFFAVAEPNTSPQVVSDVLETFITASGTLVLESFNSDSDSTPLGLCSQMFQGCQATETGGLQGGTITWEGPTGLIVATDTIEFRSDIDEIPEPSTLLLVFAILTVFGIRLHKKGASSAN